MQHKGTIRIETERLILRRFEKDDVEAMFRNWASDEKVTEFLRWKAHESISVSKEILNIWLEGYQNDNFYQWAIELKEVHEPIGTISVVDMDDRTEKVHIGYCILLHTIASFRAGRVPEYFYPWYWQLAHNRYCSFLKKKKYGAEQIEKWEEAIYEEMEFFEEDEISRLNLTISRLSREQRELVIRYYLKNETISQIAKEMGLAEGTVKRRLFDTRAELRNGVNDMTKRIGMSAYAPATLTLSGGGTMPDHWNRIGLMEKQIFVACMSEAKTIAEIADEIGVAPVYFEKKLDWLLKIGFLVERGKGKYITDFIIIPESVFRDHFYAKDELLKDIGKELTDILYASEKDIRAMDFYGNDMPYDYLLWELYCFACWGLNVHMWECYCEQYQGNFPTRKKRDWELDGRVQFADETVDYSKPYRQVSWSNIHNHFAVGGYKLVEYGNHFQAPPFPNRDFHINHANIRTIMKIFENANGTLDEHEQMQAAELMEKGFIEKRGGGLYLTLPVMHYNVRNQIVSYLKQVTAPLAEKYMKKLVEMTDAMILPHIRGDLMAEYANRYMETAFFTVNSVFYYAMHEGKTLAIPEDYNRSAAAMVLYYR